MRLETNPKVVAKLAEQCEDANWKFRTFLKGVDLEIEELDAIVHRHYEDVASQINCCVCGNCCRNVTPILWNRMSTDLPWDLTSAERK